MINTYMYNHDATVCSFSNRNFVIFKISFHVGVVFSKIFVTGESLFTVDTCFQKVHWCIFIVKCYCTFNFADYGYVIKEDFSMSDLHALLVDFLGSGAGSGSSL